MSATEQFNTPSSLKMRLMKQLQAWRDAEENPIGEDGKPAPLKMVVLKVNNSDTPLIPGLPITPTTQIPIIADKILRKMKDWASATSQGGEEIFGDLQPYFGTNTDEGQGHYGIRMKPERTAFGSETPIIGDLGNPREASGVIVRESISLTRDAMSFAGGIIGKAEDARDKVIEYQADEIKNLRQRVKDLESGQDAIRSLQNDLADKKLDRDLKSRENDMKMKVMESAGDKLISYIPLFTSKIDEYMVKKLGNGEKLSDEGKFYKSVVEVILSKLQNEEQAKTVFRALGLTKEDLVKIQSAGNKLQLEEKRGEMHEEAKSLMRGGPIRNIRRLLPPASRGIPTIPNPSNPKPAAPNGAAKTPPIEVEGKVVPQATGT